MYTSFRYIHDTCSHGCCMDIVICQNTFCPRLACRSAKAQAFCCPPSVRASTPSSGTPAAALQQNKLHTRTLQRHPVAICCVAAALLTCTSFVPSSSLDLLSPRFHFCALSSE